MLENVITGPVEFKVDLCVILFQKKVQKANLKTDLVVLASSSKFQPRLRLHEGQ